MGIGIFDRLGFPSSMANNTVVFSQDTQNSLNNMPQILTTWQMEDIANTSTTGYYQNPVDSISSSINTIMGSIRDNAVIKGYTEISDAANGVLDNSIVTSFIGHTNRLSGVEPVTANTVHLPHYQTCIGLGKALTYIVYQSDGISNNAVLMGNFGSLFTGNTLTTYYSTLNDDLTLVLSPSLLTPTQNAAIASHINTVNTYIVNSMTQDIDYFANCNSLIADYNTVKGFTQMGDTEKYLVNNLVGTDKLKSRIS